MTDREVAGPAPSDRLRCEVPFCRRTCKGRSGQVWICGEHWRLIPLMRRKVFNRLAKRKGWAHRDTYITWRDMVRYAIERAAGITR